MHQIRSGDIEELKNISKHFPLVVTLPPDDEGRHKVIMSIDPDSNIDITGTQAELTSVLDDPNNKFSLWVLRPLIILALEIVRLRNEPHRRKE